MDEEEKTQKMYEDIVKFCRTTQTSYIDYSFPPDDRSIGEIMAQEAKKKLNPPTEHENLYWLRPHEIEDSDDDFYEDDDYYYYFEWSVLKNPEPSDVIQSTIIGDCSLISSMAVIAERPDLLDRIFPSKEISPEGVYRVRLHINGEWKTIIVDDYFPCYIHSGKMATCIGIGKQLWAPLIEKALAKIMGSYSEIGKPTALQFPLSILTGAHCVYHRVPKDPDEIDFFWNVLMSSSSSGFLMCFTSHITKNFVRDKNVAPSHAFSFLTLNDEYKNRLLRLRNPWGKTEWAGKWSDDWDGWPASMKQKLLIGREDEIGAFWMELDDFMDMFQGVTICKIRPDWHETRQEITFGLNTQTIRLTVTETCEASFSAIVKIPDTIETIDLMLSVHRISQENIIGELIGRSDRFPSLSVFSDELLLTPGEYIVMIFNIENMNKVNIPIYITCISSKPIFYELMKLKPQMFSHALREIVLKDGEQKTPTVYGIYYRSLMKQFDGKLLMIDNFHNNKYVHLKYEMSNSENLKFSRGSSSTIDVIPPRSYQIISIMTPVDREKNLEWDRTHKVILRSEKFINDDITDDETITGQNIQHFPNIDSSDPIHYPQSIYYDLGPNVDEILEQKIKCPKRIKHFLWLCDCRG